MFRNVLVPLDGSELAERALPYAVRLASAAHGELILLRVALASPSTRIDGADWESEQVEAVEEAEAYLLNVADTLDASLPVKTSAPYGRAARKILEAIEALGADGVVMATHGRTGPAHLVYGSVAEAVLADSPVPVFLVHARPGEAAASPFNASGVRALVPLDGSALAEAALPAAADLVGTTGELVLVTVLQPPDHVERDENGRVLAYLDQQEEALTREARDYLSQLAQQLAHLYPGMRVSAYVRIGEPAPGIVVAAADRNADIVVMATHGRTGLRRAVLGSVAGAVLRAGNTPVLLIGPHEAHRPTGILVAHGQTA